MVSNIVDNLVYVTEIKSVHARKKYVKKIGRNISKFEYNNSKVNVEAMQLFK